METEPTFVLVKMRGKFPWYIKHTPTGVWFASFVYKINATGYMQALDALLPHHPSLALTDITPNALKTAFAARVPFLEADRAQMMAQAVRKAMKNK